MHVASRLVEIQLQIRTIFRSAIDSDLTDDLLPEQIAQPIHGDYPADTFAPPAATQQVLDVHIPVEGQAVEESLAVWVERATISSWQRWSGERDPKEW